MFEEAGIIDQYICRAVEIVSFERVLQDFADDVNHAPSQKRVRLNIHRDVELRRADRHAGVAEEDVLPHGRVVGFAVLRIDQRRAELGFRPLSPTSIQEPRVEHVVVVADGHPRRRDGCHRAGFGMEQDLLRDALADGAIEQPDLAGCAHHDGELPFVFELADAARRLESLLVRPKPVVAVADVVHEKRAVVPVLDEGVLRLRLEAHRCQRIIDQINRPRLGPRRQTLDEGARGRRVLPRILRIAGLALVVGAIDESRSPQAEIGMPLGSLQLLDPISPIVYRRNRNATAGVIDHAVPLGNRVKIIVRRIGNAERRGAIRLRRRGNPARVPRRIADEHDIFRRIVRIKPNIAEKIPYRRGVGTAEAELRHDVLDEDPIHRRP